jgi:hypothetical protein
MGACALVSILASLLLCAEAASSDPFSSSHVATLGNDYDEKVRDCVQASVCCAPRCTPFLDYLQVKEH